MVKHFESVERSAEATEILDALPELEFTLPGGDTVYTASRPKDAIWARAAAAGSNRTPIHLRIAAMLDFFDAALDPKTRQVFRDRFEDPDDALDLHDVLPVIGYLAEEWGQHLPSATGPEANRAARRRR